MGGDEGRSEPSDSQMVWAGKITHTTAYLTGGRSFERILQPQLKAGAEPGAKRLKFTLNLLLTLFLPPTKHILFLSLPISLTLPPHHLIQPEGGGVCVFVCVCVCVKDEPVLALL